MSGEPTHKELEDGLHTLRTQGDGMLELEVIRPSESTTLLLCAHAGNDRARRTLTPVMGLLKSIGEAPRKAPRLCGSCPRAVRRNSRFSIVVAWPSCNDPTQALSLAICERCANDHAGIEAKATAALRRLWPNLTTVRLTHASGGRA